MLTHLLIRDFTIVDQVSLELGAGMTVLTGETGAGKSILVDALGLVLGDRATGAIVRPGAERAEVTASFETASVPQVRHRLAELDLDSPDEVCILRRTVSSDGRSRAFINGRPTPLQGLREIGELLVDIHGQHAHQSLLRRDTQRAMLDQFAGLATQLASARALHTEWERARAAIAALGGSAADRAAEAELLRYQVEELRALALRPGEVEELDEEHRRLSHAGALLGSAQRALAALEEAEDGALLPRLEGVAREVDDMTRFDPRTLPVRELLDGALIQGREAAHALHRYAEAIELDPERLAWLEQRIAALETLARKHRVSARSLAEHLDRLEARLTEIEQGDEHLRALEGTLEACARRYADLAEELYRGRAAAAPALAEAVASNARSLGMGGSRFQVRVEPPGGQDPSPHGGGRVELYFSANPGQPLAPLSQVASGGELSRLSLAIQLIGAHGEGAPIQVFDEVDTGIGGRVAEVVGRALRRLADTRQVLCVTHLPQVASQGQGHLLVSKAARGEATYASVTPLQPEDRVREVARMLGGVEITARALAHAREMLDRASKAE
jgi:DNA repair protein RecN (Recombination protein N)